MDDYQFNDLKQFIANTVKQTEVTLTRRIDGLEGRMDSLEGRMGGMEGRMARLEQKVDDGFAGIAETIEQMNQRHDDRDKEVDQRFTKLEGQMAA